MCCAQLFGSTDLQVYAYSFAMSGPGSTNPDGAAEASDHECRPVTTLHVPFVKAFKSTRKMKEASGTIIVQGLD